MSPTSSSPRVVTAPANVRSAITTATMIARERLTPATNIGGRASLARATTIASSTQIIAAGAIVRSAILTATMTTIAASTRHVQNDFTSWREKRQHKRGLLRQIREHMEIVGKDDNHVGKVDKTAGDRVVLASRTRTAAACTIVELLRHRAGSKATRSSEGVGGGGRGTGWRR